MRTFFFIFCALSVAFLQLANEAYAVYIMQGSALLFTGDTNYKMVDSGDTYSFTLNEEIMGDFTGFPNATLVLNCPAGLAFKTYNGQARVLYTSDITINSFTQNSGYLSTAVTINYMSRTSPGSLQFDDIEIQWVSAQPGTYYITYDASASSGAWNMTDGTVVATIVVEDGGKKYMTNGSGGGAFNSSSTWYGGEVPGMSDSVTIKAGDALTLANASVGDFVVATGGTATLPSGSTFNINGDFICDGTLSGGTSTSKLRFQASGATISGAGTVDIDGGIYLDENVTVPSDAYLTLDSRSITLAAGKKVTNNGTVTLGLYPNATLSSGTWEQGVGATLNIGYDMAWNLDADALNNTVNYYRTDLGGGQNLSPTIYHNLTLSGSGVKSMIWGNVEVKGAFTIYNNCSINPKTNALTLYGDLINYNGSEGGGYYDEFGSDGTVVFSGTNTQSIEHNGGKVYFENLTINKSTNDIALVGTDLEVSGTLTMTNGDIVMGANDVIIAGEDKISGGSSSSYLQTEGVGMLEVPYTSATGIARTYPIGDASNYMPFEFTLNSATLAGGANMRFYVKHTAHSAKGEAVSYISRYYTYEPTGFSGTIDYDMTYTYLQSDVVGTEAELKPGKHDGAGWMGGNAGAPDPKPWTTINTSTNTISWEGVSSFSDASALDGNEILPVTLLGFTAVYVGEEGVKLSWVTSMEEDNDYFTVERSADAYKFEEILTVDGAGHSDGIKEYVVYDRKSLFGNAYYRLKQTDFDGTTETFHVVQVRNVDNASLQVYPNPVKDQSVRIEGNNIINQDTRVSVSDITGRNIEVKQTAHTGSVLMQFSNKTPRGVYICTLHTPGMGSQIVRIVRE